jgi:hypothetical protein
MIRSMLRLTFIAASLLLASPALADCYRGPDSLDTGFSANNVARAVCLQDELAEEARLRSQLRQLQMQIDAFHRRQHVERLRPPIFVVPDIR